MGLVKRHKPESSPEVAPKGRAELIWDLQMGEVAVRRNAARELVSFPDSVSSLVERLTKDPDAGVRNAIGTTLVALGDPAAPQGVAPLLESSDAALRNQARELLALLPGAELVAWELLGHSKANVRVFAAEVLVHRLGPDAADRLADRIAIEIDVNACSELIERLAAIGTSQHLGALEIAAARFAHSDFLMFAVEEARQRLTRVVAPSLTPLPVKDT